MAHVERVLHVAGRVVLRLEEGVEVPERRLDHRRDDFGEAHLEERAAGLLDDFAERVDLGRVDVLGGELDVVGAEFDFAPGAGFEVFGGEGVALDDFADMCRKRLLCLQSVSESVRSVRFLIFASSGRFAKRVANSLPMPRPDYVRARRMESVGLVRRQELDVDIGHDVCDSAPCRARSKRSQCPVRIFDFSIHPRAGSPFEHFVGCDVGRTLPMRRNPASAVVRRLSRGACAA